MYAIRSYYEPIRDYLQFATISGNPFKLMPYGDSLKVNAISIPTPQGDVLYARFKNTKKAYCLMCGQIIECWNPQRKLKTTPLMQLGFTPYRSEEFMVNTDHFMYILGYSSPGFRITSYNVCYTKLLRPDGLVVISGCAHSGICNIVAYARKVTGVQVVKSYNFV